MTVPNLGWIHKTVCFVTDALIQEPGVSLRRPTHRPYENNQHHMLREFLNGPWDWWLSMDADNPPMRNPLELIALDKDIVGLPTPVWHYTGQTGERPIYLNVYRRVDDGYKEWLPQEGLQEVDAVGTGCFLMARRVAEQLAFAKPFNRTHYDDGRVEYGNDLAFCQRAKAAGFTIWAHFDYMCRHWNEVDLVEVMQAYSRMMADG